MNNILNKAISDYISDSRYPLYNFNLGKIYEDLGHNSAAISFYLRTAEFGTDNLLSYESLLRLSLCLEKQGDRIFSLKGVLLRAISLIPTRPEAYFLLCRIYEMNKDWHECYAFASIGEKLINDDIHKLETNVEYPGKYVFIFEKAVSAWWIGLYNESIYLFRLLDQMPNILSIHKECIKNNLFNLGYLWKKEIKYDESYYPYLKLKFDNASMIKQNYSQCYQDIFILTMLNGKKNGSFLEIGCGDPFFNNNTILLEKEFDWNGISIDINKNNIDNFLKFRKSNAICFDATKIDYNTILDSKNYDYLQIDCDPAIISYNVLLKIPFETHKFAVITFEHEHYCDNNKEIRDKSRNYFESFGYKMIVNNISEDRYSDFEDWWVHPDLVDSKIIEKMTCISDDVKKADLYMLNKL
jgi:hypothetical protein